MHKCHIPWLMCLPVLDQYVFYVPNTTVHHIVQELLEPTLMCLFHLLVIAKSVHYPLCHIHFELGNVFFRILTLQEIGHKCDCERMTSCPM